MNLRDRIDAAPMSRYQWMIIGLCVLLNTLDGFDVMTMAFTANGVSKEFDLSGTELGVLLSAGLVGMAIGSLFLAPFADVVGRRPTVLACVAMAGTGMLLGALSPTALTLGGARVLTGLGVGGILACTNVIASEYSNSRRRGLAIGIYSAGYGLGATLGGLAAVGLQEQFGWRAVFVVGAVATFAALALLAVLLPESVDFLLHRRRPDMVARLNKILARVGQPQIASADEAPAPRGPGGEELDGRARQVGSLLTPALRRSTVLVWLAFFATMFGFYFVNTWTPKLLVESGLSDQQAVTAGLMIALGGTVGAVGYGVVATRGDNRRVLMWFTLLAAVTMVVLILTTAVLAVALAVGVVVGALINGCIAGLYTVTPALYDPRIRSHRHGLGHRPGPDRRDPGAAGHRRPRRRVVVARAAVRRRRRRGARGARCALPDARPRHHSCRRAAIHEIWVGGLTRVKE